ncbi:MAG: PAS domain-containing protein [Deltaproteobacteria bacterium]|nr:PAS domain-containing protein [Deltaproteobacteria bacterium]
MSKTEQLQTIIQDQTRMLIEKNRRLADLEYRIREMIVTGSRKEDLARLQAELSQETIEGQSSLFHTLLETVPCGIVVFNTKRIVVTANPRALVLLDIVEDEILGKEIDLFLHPCMEKIEKALDPGETHRAGRVPFPKKSGGEIHLDLHITPILNHRRSPLGGIVLLYETPAGSPLPLHGEETPESNIVPYVP